MSRVVYRTCTLCEACCGIAIHVSDDRIDAITGDEQDPASRGYVCAKAAALADLHSDPDRLRYPMRRRGSTWHRIGWDQAFAEAAAGLAAVQRKHGNDAVASYFGEPFVHNTGALLFSDVLLAALATTKRFSANSLDQFPKQLVSHWMYGNGLLLSVPDVDRTGSMLIIGANPAISNGSLMTAPDMPRRLREIRQRGGRIVVIDPRRSETARIADEHHFIRPGTDALLVAAMLQCLFADKRIRLGHLAPMLDGLGTVANAVAAFTPEAVAERTGIAAGTIRDIARAFADAPAAVCYGRMGTSTVPFGTTINWLIEVLNVVTGNLDREGGAMFPSPAVDVMGLQPASERGRWTSRISGTPEFMGELPAATLASEIETPGTGRTRALVTIAGNPVLSSPAGRHLSDALETLEFMVSIDFYLNETTRHADIVLPPVTPLEREQFDLVFPLFAVRATPRWSPPVFDAPPDTRTEGDIFIALAAALYRERGGTGHVAGLALQALDAIGSTRAMRLVLDAALRAGPYGNGLRPWKSGLTLARLKAAAHGMDFGPMRPCLPERLPRRAGGRIDLAPQELVADLQRLHRTLTHDAAPLVLIGIREARTLNSWSHNLPRLVTGPDRCVLHMHPDDAASRTIAAGDRVRITSRTGAVEVPVRLSDNLAPGVVALPHGYGHGNDGTWLRVAAGHAGASINDLTDAEAIDPLSGNAVLSGVPVSVERCVHPDDAQRSGAQPTPKRASSVRRKSDAKPG